MRKKMARQEEEPKAVREMKKNKNKEIKKENRRKNKKEIKKKRKKIILIIIVLTVLTFGIFLGITGHTWTTLAVDMVSNESSIVIDTNGNTIAKLRR